VHGVVVMEQHPNDGGAKRNLQTSRKHCSATEEY
jgi:hypothetical protein